MVLKRPDELPQQEELKIVKDPNVSLNKCGSKFQKLGDPDILLKYMDEGEPDVRDLFRKFCRYHDNMDYPPIPLH